MNQKQAGLIRRVQQVLGRSLQGKILFKDYLQGHELSMQLAQALVSKDESKISQSMKNIENWLERMEKTESR